MKADEVALEAVVSVALIRYRLEFLTLGIRLQLGAGAIEQRPPQENPAQTLGGQGFQRRHSGQPLGARAAQQLQQDGFGLVIGVMRQRDHISSYRLKSGVARAPRLFFQTGAGRTADPNPPHTQRHIERGTDAPAVTRPRVGIGAQPVMNVKRLN